MDRNIQVKNLKNSRISGDLTMKHLVHTILKEMDLLRETNRYVLKNILRKCATHNSDIQLALLNFRNTPRNKDLQSPNERLFSRKTRSNIPISQEKLKPKIVEEVETKLKKLRDKQNFYSNRGAKEPELLQQGDKIRYQVGKRDWHNATVTDETKNPRSVIIETNDKIVTEEIRHTYIKQKQKYKKMRRLFQTMKL
ncbi:hypothetical protein QE152_g3862 [Popillia japonica]|uniref:Uncharacterized protein n=1 Tax=Popillia japonica TaxID=7064 RepID=A0AAW1N2U2_POPJA